MAKKKSKTSGAKSPSFEQSLEQLRDVVGELENGNLTLEDSLKKYELGVTCLKACYQSLNQAQRRIEVLVDLDEEGNLVTQSFDDTASELVADGTRRQAAGRRSVQADDAVDPEPSSEEEDEDMDDSDRLF